MGMDFVSNTTPAKKLGEFRNWTRFHIQVRDASTVFLANTRNALEVPGIGGAQGGLAITSASGIISLNWYGELYAIGNNPVSVYDIEIFEDAAPC
jgi:hypothetical protein